MLVMSDKIDVTTVLAMLPMIIVPLLFSVIGIFLCITAIKQIRQSICVMEVEARCIRILKKDRGMEGIGVLYCPEYEFYHEDRYVRVCSNKYVPDCGVSEGDCVQISVDKKHPERMAGPKQFPLAGFILLFMGISFTVTPLSFFVPTILFFFLE